ncbi:magnesium transporter [Fodinicurvata sp. EGI_FJ10296]|uniref:magnesium transporter n=1 Tax=Fodinicurvata sp. EGI_FJ10296 TaxID=3231908 RepID=UPI003453D662
MSDTTEQTDISESLEAAIDAGDGAALNALLDPLPYNEALRELLNLSQARRYAAFDLMPVELAAELVEEAPYELAAELIEHVAAARAAEILDEMHSDVQADVVREMDDAAAEAVFAEMDADEAADLRRLVEYDAESAGGLMMSEVFSFPQHATVGAVLKRLAGDGEDDFERYRGQHPYMLDDAGRPVGVVSLRLLLTTRRSVALSEIMIAPMTVSVDTPLDTLENLFDEHPFLGLPVVDEAGILVGVVSRSAVDEALVKRAERSHLRQQGVFGDELRSMPLKIRAGRRLGWLSANIVLNILAAGVIALYEETLAAVIALAIFLPMVSDMSGNAGMQAIGVTMRELSLGLVRPVDALRVWLKELSVGVINGIALGILIAIVAWVWKGNGWLGLVVGLALAANTVIAVSIGGVAPLILKRLGQDPAVASGPVLTTITDMAGFFLVLSLATLMMPLLV